MNKRSNILNLISSYLNSLNINPIFVMDSLSGVTHFCTSSDDKRTFKILCIIDNNGNLKEDFINIKKVIELKEFI
jgi:hypothetical protein